MRSDRYKEEDKKNKKQEAPKPAQKAKKGAPVNKKIDVFLL